MAAPWVEGIDAAQLEVYFEQADIDHSSSIDLDEFTLLFCFLFFLEEAVSAVDAEADSIRSAFVAAASAFCCFDLNDDGVIERSEIKSALSGPRGGGGAFITPERMEELDWDKNGTVMFKEFLLAFLYSSHKGGPERRGLLVQLRVVLRQVPQYFRGPYSFLNWDNSMAKAINSGACHDCDLCPKPVKDKKIVDVYDRDVDILDVGVNFVKYTDYTLKVLIDSFDMNIVQVGIDVHVVGKNWNALVGAPVLHVRILDTYRSDAFEKFVKQKVDARTLQISAFGTPPHSLIRLLHKSNELDLPYIPPESDLKKLCCKGNMTNIGERNLQEISQTPHRFKGVHRFLLQLHGTETRNSAIRQTKLGIPSSHNESGRLWQARAHKKCHRWTKTCASNCPRYW